MPGLGCLARSPRSVRDLANAVGTVIDHVAYDSFGRVTSELNPSAGDRFRFTGRELDPETGLQYHRARYYDAALGRWTQEDPIGFVGGDANLYRYVGNSPTNGTDPSGLAWKYPWEKGAKWNDWRLGEAICDTINNIQVSASFGGTAEVYLGLAHYQITVGAMGGLDMKNGNYSSAFFGTIQGGGALGVGHGYGVTGTIATTGNLEDHSGRGAAYGISTPVGGVDLGGGMGPDGGMTYGSVTGSVGPSAGGGGHIDKCYTKTIFHKKTSFR